MTDFVSLYFALSETSSTSQKVRLLTEFFGAAPQGELGWAVHLLRGEKLERGLSSSQLRQLCAEVSGIPPWLLEESYQVVGDLAETISKLAAGKASGERVSLQKWVELVRSLREAPLDERMAKVAEAWRHMSEAESLVFNKLLTGGLRIGVSRGLVVKALAAAAGADEAQVSQRLLSLRDVREISLPALAEQGSGSENMAPYPFCLAHPLEAEPQQLGEPEEWIAEWKWDGIRAQIVRRGGRVAVWSRGEELVTESFPELELLSQKLPEGCVLDGEIVALDGDEPAAFSRLQQRLNRKRISITLLKQIPVGFIAYDLLELNSEDLRNVPLGVRRQKLAAILEKAGISKRDLRLSPEVEFCQWQQLDRMREGARENGAEGFMLKSRDSLYIGGRKRGSWWKWKANPYSVDGVLVYAQRGHGRRAGLFTDYTFAVWKDGELVPFAKAYSGLTDSEIREVDAFVKAHTKERFGPVRTVEPQLVFEIGFEGIQASRRHKSGVAVRFPRILRWRKDKPASEADTVETLRQLTS